MVKTGDKMSKVYKIAILFIIVIFTALSIFVIYDKTSSNSFRFLSIGDGLSKGLSPNGIKSYDYSDYICDYLTNKGKSVSNYNYSIKDISISELTNDLIYLKDKTLKEYLQTSDVIILAIGEKEINENKAIEEIEEDLTNLVQEIKRFNSNIFLIGHYYLNNGKDSKIKQINNIYREVAKNNNIVFINIEKVAYYLNKDNIYPTTRGYREISKLIISAIELKNK